MGAVDEESADVAADATGRRLAQAEEEAREVSERLRETSTALLEANQALAQIPLLEYRLDETREEAERLMAEVDGLRQGLARLEEDNARLAREQIRLEADAADSWGRVHAFEQSRSWRLLAPLRRLRATFRRG